MRTLKLSPTIIRSTKISLGIILMVIHSAEVKSQSTEYTAETKLHDLAPIKASLTVLSMESFLHPITVGALIEGAVKDKFFYNFQYRQGVIRNFMIPKDNLISTQNESNGRLIEGGVDFVFADKEKPGRIKVTTSYEYVNTTSGLGTQEKFFLAKCDVRRYWALSGGLNNYTRSMYVGSDSSEYVIVNGDAFLPPKDKSLHMNLSTTGFYGGIVRRKIRKAKITSGGYVYRRFYSTKFYADVLSGLTHVGDVTVGTNTFKPENIKQNPLGYRIGWQWDEMGVVTEFEFGKRPGISLTTPGEKSEIDKVFKNNPFINYVRFSFHFNIYNSDKNYRMKS